MFFVFLSACVSGDVSGAVHAYRGLLAHRQGIFFTLNTSHELFLRARTIYYTTQEGTNNTSSAHCELNI